MNVAGWMSCSQLRILSFGFVWFKASCFQGISLELEISRSLHLGNFRCSIYVLAKLGDPVFLVKVIAAVKVYFYRSHPNLLVHIDLLIKIIYRLLAKNNCPGI